MFLAMAIKETQAFKMFQYAPPYLLADDRIYEEGKVVAMKSGRVCRCYSNPLTASLMDPAWVSGGLRTHMRRVTVIGKHTECYDGLVLHAYKIRVGVQEAYGIMTLAERISAAMAAVCTLDRTPDFWKEWVAVWHTAGFFRAQAMVHRMRHARARSVMHVTLAAATYLDPRKSQDYKIRLIFRITAEAIKSSIKYGERKNKGSGVSAGALEASAGSHKAG